MLLYKTITDYAIKGTTTIVGTLKVAGQTIAASALAKLGSGVIPIILNYTASLVTQTFYSAATPVTVKSIIGRVRVAGTGGAATLSFFKVPSGTAVGSGTLLHTGTYNLVGTVDTNQTLTLSTTLTDLQLAAGDSIGYVLTGTATSAVGTVTVTVAPT